MPDCRSKTSRSRLYHPLPERDQEVAMIALVRKPPPSFAPSASTHRALHRTAIAPINHCLRTIRVLAKSPIAYRALPLALISGLVRSKKNRHGGRRYEEAVL